MTPAIRPIPIAALIALALAACNGGGGGGTKASPAAAGQAASVQPCDLLDDTDIERSFGEKPTNEAGGDGNCEWTLGAATVDVEVTGYSSNDEARTIFTSLRDETNESVSGDVGELGTYDSVNQELLAVVDPFIIRIAVEGETKTTVKDAILGLGRVLIGDLPAT